MSPEAGRAGFRIGCLMVLPAIVLLVFLDRGTAEFNITVFVLILGLVFLAVLTAIIRHSQR